LRRNSIAIHSFTKAIKKARNVDKFEKIVSKYFQFLIFELNYFMLFVSKVLESFLYCVYYPCSHLHLWVIVHISHSKFFTSCCLVSSLVPLTPVQRGTLNCFTQCFRAKPDKILYTSSQKSHRRV